MIWMLPGRDVTVSLVDGTSLRGVTKVCVHSLRLKHVQAEDARVPGTVVVPSRSIMTMQVM